MDKKRFSVVDEDDDLDGLDFDDNSNNIKRLKTINNSNSINSNNNSNINNNSNKNNNYHNNSNNKTSKRAIILQSINNFNQENKKFSDKIFKDNLIVLGDPIIVDDVIKLKKRLNNFFSYNGSSDQLFQLFKDGLTKLLANDQLLELALSPVVSEDPDSERSFQSSYFIDSLIKIFLGVPVIQPIVIQVLFDLMGNYLTDDPNDFIKKICSQLRWMDNIKDSDSLVDSIINLLGELVCNLELKKEIIRFLPDITDEKCHEKLVQDLVSSLDNEPTLTLPIIDCLKNMNLKSTELNDVRSKISESLVSAEMSDLPLMVAFLLTTNNPKESSQTVKSIRNGLKFSNFRNSSKDLIDFDKKRIINDTNKNKQAEALIMEIIKSGIRFKKELWSAFLKEISSITNPKDYKIIDIWLLILISSINQAKETEALFKKKILNGHFTKQLLLDSIITHDYALGSYHPQMLSFCHCFLRSAETRIRVFGSLFYQYLYGSFNEVSLRQDIIESLLSHICSNNLTEVNSGLDVLLELCKNYLDSIRDFTTCIKSILDHINFLNENQIRKLFKIYSYLMYNTKITSSNYSLAQNGSVYNELDIFTRKQITSPFLKYKKIGIISLCSQLSRLAKRIYKSAGTMELFGLPPEIEKECCDVLSSLYNNCNGSQLALAYYYDELSNNYLDENFHPTIVNIIIEKFVADFQNRFIESISSHDILWYAPTGHETEYESIVIYPSLKEIETKDKLLCLSPHFRLLQILERSKSFGSLEEINSLLVIPFKMFSKDLLKESRLSDDKDKEFYSLSLFYLINFIKELLNAFSTQLNQQHNNNNHHHHNNNNNHSNQSSQQIYNDIFDFGNNSQQQQQQQYQHNNNRQQNSNEIRLKLLTRLKDLIELEEFFELVLSFTPSFSIPYGTFDFDQRKNFTIDFRKAKRQSPIFTLYPIENSKDFKLPTETLIELEKPFIKLIKPYFRPLDLSVFLILHQQLANNSGGSNSLEPASLLYLVEDFYSKLTILATQEKTGPLSTMQPKSTLPYSYTEFISRCQFVFPNLCVYLDGSVKSLCKNRVQLLKELQQLKALHKEFGKLSNKNQDASSDDEQDQDDGVERIEELKKKIKSACKLVVKLNDLQTVLQKCIQLSLKCFEKLFQTGDLIAPESNNNNLFFTVMRSIYEKIKSSFASDQSLDSTSQTTGSLQIISLRIFSYFERFIQSLVASKSFKSSFSLLEVLVSLSSNSWSTNRDNEELNNKIHRFSYLLLSTPWTQGDKQKVTSTAIGSILNTFLKYSKSPRNSLKHSIIFLYTYLRDHQSSGKNQKNVITTTSASKKKKGSGGDSDDEDDSNDNDSDNENSNDQYTMEEIEELNNSKSTYEDYMSDDNDISDIESTLINPFTCLAFLKTIFNFLVEHLTKTVSQYKEKDPSISSLLLDNNSSVAYFQRLVETFRFREKSLYLAEILKQGIAFVNVYSKFIGILKPILKKNEQIVGEFVTILEKLQIGTRSLHNICDHGKKEKDKYITPFIPQAKKTLETLNMDIKMLLSSMNALNAYSTKKINRTNLKGKEISSSQEEEEEEEEESEYESDNSSPSEQEEEAKSSDSNSRSISKKRDRSVSSRGSSNKRRASTSDSSDNEKRSKSTKSTKSKPIGKRLRKLKAKSDSDEEMHDEEEQEEEQGGEQEDRSDDSDIGKRGRSRNRSRSRSRSRSSVYSRLRKKNQSPSRSRSSSGSGSIISGSEGGSPQVSEAEEGDESEHSGSEPENAIDISQSEHSSDDNKNNSSDNEDEDDDFIASD